METFFQAADHQVRGTFSGFVEHLDSHFLICLLFHHLMVENESMLFFVDADLKSQFHWNSHTLPLLIHSVWGWNMEKILIVQGWFRSN